MTRRSDSSQSGQAEAAAGRREEAPGAFSRREAISLFAAAASVPLFGLPPLSRGAEQGVLPLDTPGLDHLDIIVPDVEASSRFYMSLFNTRLHAQPFQGGFRYFVLLGELNERREVGYIAIGESRGRGTYIGHFCTSVHNYRANAEAIRAAMTGQFRAAGFGDFPGPTGVGGIFADPDGIEIQFLPAPDTLVTAAVPSDLVASNQGLLTPLAVDHVLLRVSDLAKASEYYRILYGEEGFEEGDGRNVFSFENGSRLILAPADYVYGQSLGIEHFCIAVAPFERERAQAVLLELGAEVLEAGEEPEVLRFRDKDGISVEIRPRGA